MFFKVYSIINQIEPFVKRAKENYFHEIYKQMFLFCLTDGVAVCYNAKCIGKDTSKMPVSVKETSGQACSHCLMQFAAVRQIWL